MICDYDILSLHLYQADILAEYSNICSCHLRLFPSYFMYKFPKFVEQMLNYFSNDNMIFHI